MRLTLRSPIACRCAGLRLGYLDLFDSGCGPHGEDPPADFEERLTRQRRELWGLLDSPAFVGCLATMNPNALLQLRKHRAKGLGDGPRTHNAERRERLLYRFLCRFVGRNDTTGLAGTCFWGRFNDGGSQHLSFTYASPTKIRLAYASPAHRAHLEQVLRRKHAPQSRRPVRSARLRIDGGRVTDVVTGREVPLTQREVELLAACSGEHAIEELTAEDPALSEALDRLCERGWIEPHGHLPPLHPLDHQLRRSLATLSQELGESLDDAVSGDLQALLDYEERLRSCRVEELADVMSEAEEHARRLVRYMPVDPAGTLVRVIAGCALDERCSKHLELVLSERFRLSGHDLHDASSRSVTELTPDDADALDRFRSPSSVARALGASRPGQEWRARIEDWVERRILCLAGADPWTLRGASRPDFDWDPWEKLWFWSALDVLERVELPPDWRDILRLLPSCRTVEQKSYEAFFPDIDPLTATDRVRTALATLGVDAVTGRKDHSFFLIDSLLEDASFEVGGGLSKAVSDALSPLLELLGVRAWAWEQSVLLPRLRAAIPLGGSAPLAQVLSWTDRWVRDWEGPFGEALGPSLSFEHGDQEDVLEITGFDAPDGYATWLADKRLTSTIDLMLAGSLDDVRRGRWRLVINEAHSTGAGLPETMHVPWTSHLPQQGFTDSHAGPVFGGDLLLLQPLLPTKQAQSIAHQLRGASLAVRCPANGTAWDGEARPISTLEVTRDEEGFRVTDGERTYALMSADLSTGSLRSVRFDNRMFSARITQLAGSGRPGAVPGATVLPEIRMGSLTVCRKAFVLEPSWLGAHLNGAEGVELLRAMGQIRRELRLPRLVFVSLFEEKPFLCDTESLFSVEVLAHALRQNAREVIFTEMNPGPSELWLEIGDAAVPSEWRFAVTLDGDRFDPKAPALLPASAEPLEPLG